MQAVLALNSGSSSIKFALYKSDEDPEQPFLICRGKLDGIPHHLNFTAQVDQENIKEELPKTQANFTNALSFLVDWIKQRFNGIQLIAAGHRIVHGGMNCRVSTFIDKEVIKYLETLIPLAPLHQPHNIAGVSALQEVYPSLAQIACFDTAFHSNQPRLATLFGLPFHFWQEGIQRFGFHGLSYKYISSKLPEIMGDPAYGRIVVAHLGHGASLCALKDLKSIATTMGLTALDGLPMGTRCGNLDPGVIIYLMSQKGYSIQAINELLYNQSGLLGLSGISDDMQELLTSNSARASEAIDYFCYRILREIGSLVAALGGLDALIFTGGIGENAATIRQKICDELGWLNININHKLNNSTLPNQPFSIHLLKDSLPVWVIPTNEEIAIAQDVFKLIREKEVKK